MTDVIRPVVLSCVLVVALVAPAGAVLAGTGASGDGTIPFEQQAANETTASNGTNASTAHRDPNEVGQQGDIDALRSWLIGQLAGRLGNGAVQLSQGEYDAARELLGDDFNNDAEKLVDVVGETESTRTIERTRENQRDLTNATEDYRETYDEYREARENGNNDRARELARELERDASRVVDTAEGTRDGYGRLGNQTGQNFTEERDSVTEVEENVTELQEDVRTVSFDETVLSVTGDGTQVSFLDPLEVSGTLMTENGSAVTNEAIRLRIGSQSYRTTTDADGAFEVEYRPTTFPVNATEVTVEYQPVSSSPYLNSSATLPIDVEQVTPTVSIEWSASSARYNQTVTVTGRISVEDEGGSVPLVVQLGETRLATTRSGEDGRYNATVRIPAGVAEGARALSVRVAQENRALASGSANSELRIEETPTTLSIEASNAGKRSVRVSGTLETSDGEIVPNQQVTLAVGGEAVETVTTNRRGTFSATVAVPDDADVNGTVAVGATFDGEATNLESSAANATADLPAAGEASGGGSSTDTISEESIVGIVIGLLVLAGLAALGARYWPASSDSGTADVPSEPTSTASSSELGTDGDALGARLASARKLLSSGETDASLVTTYATVRARFREQVAGSGLTHWEFYNASADVLADDERSLLQRLTSAYEQAQFSRESVSLETARSLVTDASETVEADSRKSTDLSE